jgi:hypothetical protein
VDKATHKKEGINQRNSCAPAAVPRPKAVWLAGWLNSSPCTGWFGAHRPLWLPLLPLPRAVVRGRAARRGLREGQHVGTTSGGSPLRQVITPAQERVQCEDHLP